MLGLAGSTTSDPPILPRVDQDDLEQRISSTIADSQPKPSQGPDLSDRISSLVRALVGKSDFAKVVKVCDKYPRSGNVPELVTPELTQDVDKTIDSKVIKDDKRLKLDQSCTTAATAALGKALDMVLLAKEQVPGLAKVGDILVDCITLTGFLHSEYSNLRLKGFKQTVNPSYSDILSYKPEEPQLLMGKASISEQIKTCEDLQKVKNKLKKHDSVILIRIFPGKEEITAGNWREMLGHIITTEGMTTGEQGGFLREGGLSHVDSTPTTTGISKHQTRPRRKRRRALAGINRFRNSWRKHSVFCS